MPSGGARSRSGPPPDPNALRRNRNTDSEWTTLPAEGRPGEPPEWPLPQCSSREKKLWRELWAKPQATQWDKLGLTYEVALLTRRMTEAEQRESATNISTLVRQLWDDLGLSVAGMRTNRWKIADEATATHDDKPQTSARERLKVVPPPDAG